MMTKDTTEITQTVPTAMSRRRKIYASIRTHLLLKEERLWPRRGRGHAIRTVVLPRRVVPHSVTHDAHTLCRRGESHGADDPLFLHGNAPDLLAELDALLLRCAKCLLPQLYQLLHG